MVECRLKIKNTAAIALQVRLKNNMQITNKLYNGRSRLHFIPACAYTRISAGYCLSYDVMDKHNAA